MKTIYSLFLLLLSIESYCQWNYDDQGVIYSNGARVGIGIGTALPNANLQLGRSTEDGLLNLGGYSFVGSLRSSGDFFAGMNAYAEYSTSAENSKIKVYYSNNNGFSAMQMSHNGDINFYVKMGSVSANEQINIPAYNALKISGTGLVGIGTDNPDGYKLAVAGKMITEEVVVQLKATWPDYVFEDGYRLRPLSDLAEFIKVNRHLPDVPTGDEVGEGVSLGEMNVVLLKKIEELTLYLIEQKNEIDELRTEVNRLKKK